MKKKSTLAKVLFIGLIATKILATEEINDCSINVCIDENSSSTGVDFLENLYNKSYFKKKVSKR
jgi:hypothetical protein